MTCEQRLELPRLGFAEISEAERARLLAHAAACADCAEALAALERAERALGAGAPNACRAEVAALSERARGAMWARIAAATAGPRWGAEAFSARPLRRF